MARCRLLITGAGGLLGDELTRLCREGAWAARVEAVPLGVADLDVTDDAAVAVGLDRHRPDVVVNCAAYTRVDDAEHEVEAAMRVNGEAPGRLAARCRDRGVRLVHPSTDYVFDGRKRTPYVETDAVGPLSAYGRSKLAGERAVAAAYGEDPVVATSTAPHDWLVVRTQWLYGRVGPAFVKTVLRRAGRGEPLRVVDDQWGAPTWGRDLAEAIVALVEAGAGGLVHVANAGAATWYDVALAALEARGLAGRVPLARVPTSAVPRPAVRPAYGVLDCARYRRLTGRAMRPWREALADFLATGYEEA